MAGDPGAGHIAFVLALAGRLVPDGGGCNLDGDSRLVTRQRAVALVDVEGVSSPDDSIPVTTVVGEELAMARRRSGPGHVRAWMLEHELDPDDGRHMEDLTPAERVMMLSRLAALRRVRFLLLALPERLGGLPDGWLGTLLDLGSQGLGVLVTSSHGVAARIPGTIPTVVMGNDRASS